MPLPQAALAVKGLALVRQAHRVLARWNTLPPDQKEAMHVEANEVMSALADVRRALHARMTKASESDLLSWEEARDAVLRPSAEFLMAKRIVAWLRDSGEAKTREIADGVGAVGKDDQCFKGGMAIATDSGFVEPAGLRTWRVSEFADAVLIESEHVRYIENEIVEYLEGAGMADRDELALEVGADGWKAPEFRAALERALYSGHIVWAAPATFALPLDKLRGFESPEEATDGSDPGSEVEPPPDLGLAATRLRAALGRLAKSGAGSPHTTSARGERHVPSALPEQNADPIARLRELGELRDAGVVTHDEFEAKKAELLAKV